MEDCRKPAFLDDTKSFYPDTGVLSTARSTVQPAVYGLNMTQTKTTLAQPNKCFNMKHILVSSKAPMRSMAKVKVKKIKSQDRRGSQSTKAYGYVTQYFKKHKSVAHSLTHLHT